MSGDPYKYFRTEAREIIDALMQGVMEIEKGQSDARLVSRLLRYSHTLKGAARVVKQTHIAELSHAAEEVLAGLRDHGAGLSSHQIRELLAWIDGMSAELAALAPPIAVKAAQTVAREPAVPPAAESAEPADARFQTLRVQAEDMDALLRTVSEARVQMSGLSRQTRELEQAARLAGELAARPPGRSPAGAPGSDGAEQLEKLLRDVHRTVCAVVERSDRELGALYEQAGAMRLVPVSWLFPFLERTLRDAADSTGKQATFQASGGEVRLDASTLRLLRDALVHIVRNAVTHGIERPAERVAAGKPVIGCLQMKVERHGDAAVFFFSDDGKGVDVERVREVLLARRRVTPAEALELTPERAMTLLLGGGISTTQTVSQLSGRGIGFDVVREAVASLDGAVAAWSDPGRGTRIELSVPVTVESREVLHVQAGQAIVSIPLQAIKQAVRLSEADIARLVVSRSIAWGGQVVPFAPLSRLLMQSESGGLATSLSALVLQPGSLTAALGVDHVVGTERVVIRSMPEILGPTPIISGAFLDGSGDPQMVMSPEGLIQAIHSAAAEGPASVPARRLPLLVIDDSLTTRMLEQGILETAGYEVDTASSGEEALEKARQRRYGAFIVDVEMPGMDGFAFIQAARAEPELGAVPSIVVTSRDSAEDRRRGAHVGAVAYMVKSAFDEELLLKTIGELVA